MENEQNYNLETGAEAEDPAARGQAAQPPHANPTPGEGNAGPRDMAELGDPFDQLACLAAERDRLAAEKDALQNLLQRRQADFENFRRRVLKEKSELLEFGATETVREMLPVLDDFERALAVSKFDEQFVQGMRLIHQRMYDALKKIGLEPVEATGQPFDPHFHEAIEMVQSEEHDDHTVFDEYQRGYKFKGRLLRPSMVRVAVQPARQSE